MSYAPNSQKLKEVFAEFGIELKSDSARIAADRLTQRLRDQRDRFETVGGTEMMRVEVWAVQWAVVELQKLFVQPVGGGTPGPAPEVAPSEELLGAATEAVAAWKTGDPSRGRTQRMAFAILALDAALRAELGRAGTEPSEDTEDLRAALVTYFQIDNFAAAMTALDAYDAAMRVGRP